MLVEYEASAAWVRAASAIPRPAFSVMISSDRPSSEMDSCSTSSIWRGEMHGHGLLDPTRRRVALLERTPDPFKGEADWKFFVGLGLSVRDEAY